MNGAGFNTLLGLRLLLVEDSEDDAELIVREIRRQGPEVTHRRVQTREDYAAALEDSPWDLIIADFSLPQFSGLDALRRLRQLQLDVPFIIVSGTISEEMAVAAMKAGADDYVMKDNLARLWPAVQRELKDADDRRRRREAEESARSAKQEVAEQAEKLAREETLLAELAEAHRLSEAIIRINASITSSLELPEILRRVVAETADALGCNAIVLEERDGDNWVIREVAGLSGDLRGLRLTDSEAPTAVAVAAVRDVLVLSDTVNDSRVTAVAIDRYGMTACLGVPLLLREDLVGVLLCIYGGGPRAFSQPEVDFARKLSGAVALALRNAELLAAERRIADTLQEGLLTVPEEVPGLSVGHVYRSATEAAKVGGDFFDIFAIDGARVGLMVGDVCGQGVEAARMASTTRDTVRAYAYQGADADEVLRQTNQAMLRNPAMTGFVTVFLGILDVGGEELAYATAGHPPALMLRPDAPVEALGSGSLPLGIFAEAEYRLERAGLAVDDVLFIYTDGLIEARAGDDLFGEDRLRVALADALTDDLAGLPERILATVDLFSGGTLSDDVAMLVVRREAVAGGHQNESARPQAGTIAARPAG